ncbi:winged helix DNA-binding domain-containing protein [Egicoccus sp. AB-alg2]|uniref:winged helix DNA-binding domain-containing protein n=1 Tax=Egicoccus sp. AB-alg2 TaxID=3242693 RepID=UPI00359CCDA2
MDARAIARWRVRTLRLAGQGHASPEAVVGGLLGVQAENHGQASWAVATRTNGLTETEFARRFDAGTVLRTHVLRPTWHFVRPGDIRWLLELTAPRIRRTFRLHERELGLDGAAIERSRSVIASSLAADGPLTRAALGERLREAGLPAVNLALAVLMADVELEAIVCSGPLVDGQHTYALLDERAPSARRRDRDEAVAELVVRYFTGHGPATERDLTYWATMTVTDVRAGLAAAGDRLASFEHDGRTYWHGGEVPDDGPLEPRGHLLQTLDEYHNGYQDSRDVLDVDGIVPRSRRTVGMALVDAQMVGGMRRRVEPDRVVFEVELFRGLAPDERAALHDAAERYGDFLGRSPELVLSGP